MGAAVDESSAAVCTEDESLSLVFIKGFLEKVWRNKLRSLLHNGTAMEVLRIFKSSFKPANSYVATFTRFRE